MLKKLASESLIYGISGTLTRFVSVFLVPIYTSIFSPAEFGIISLVTTLSAFLSILLILSLDNSMGRWYYDTEIESDRRTTLNTFLWSCCGAAILLSAIVILLSDLIADHIFRDAGAKPLLVLMAINLPLTVFSVFTTNLLRLQRRATATAVFSLTTGLLAVGLNVLFIVILRQGMTGIFYAQIITSFVAIAATVALFWQHISVFAFDRRRWAEMFRFSLPLVPATIANWVINLSGVYFIQLLRDTREVGLYQVGLTVAGIAALATSAFQMAWAPYAYSIHKQAGAKQIYAQALLGFLAVSCSLSVGIMLFAPEVLTVLTKPDYYEAAFGAGLLAFNQVIIGVSSIAAIGPGIAKNNKPYGIAMMISAGLLIVLNLALVPRFGGEGAAIAILLSQSVVPVIVFARGQRLYPIPYRFFTALLITICSFAVAVSTITLVGYWTPSFTTALVFKMSVLTLFCGVLFFSLRNYVKPVNSVDIDPSAV